MTDSFPFVERTVNHQLIIYNPRKEDRTPKRGVWRGELTRNSEMVNDETLVRGVTRDDEWCVIF